MTEEMNKGNFPYSFFLSIKIFWRFPKNLYIINMTRWVRNAVSKLYNAISAPVAATRDALAERLQSVRETASLLFNRMMENMEYGWQRLKYIVEKEAQEEQQQHDEEYDTVPEINLVHEGRRAKEFRVTVNLNNANTSMIMDNITSHTEMRTKVIYSFKAEIHRGAGEIVDSSKTLTSLPGIFTSLEKIQAYIEECEQKWLDLDNEDVWSKAYLPAERATEIRGNYKGKVIFKHVQIRLVASNEPLIGCESLPDWLRKKRYIYAVDNFDDNMCVWRCLAIYNRKDIKRGTEFVTKAG